MHLKFFFNCHPKTNKFQTKWISSKIQCTSMIFSLYHCQYPSKVIFLPVHTMKFYILPRITLWILLPLSRWWPRNLLATFTCFTSDRRGMGNRHRSLPYFAWGVETVFSCWWSRSNSDFKRSIWHFQHCEDASLVLQNLRSDKPIDDQQSNFFWCSSFQMQHFRTNTHWSKLSRSLFVKKISW